MPPSESSDPDSPRPPRKEARRDPRLDAKPSTPGNRPSPSSPPRPPESRVSKTPSALPPKRIPAPTPLPAPEEMGLNTADVEIVGKPKPRSSRQRNLMLGAGIGTLLVIALAIGIQFAFFGSKPVSKDGQVGSEDGQSAPADEGPLSELRESVKPVLCRIYTPEPGFVAFIDNQPVRDAEGQIVLTPCEVQVERGKHLIRVEKHGWNDEPREVDITKETEIDAQPLDEPITYKHTTFKAPYLNAKVGEPILLEALQSSGRCQDPFVSPNGQEIWYSASGAGGTGIYYSTRDSAYEEWSEPAILVLSKGFVLPASPSATENGLIVAYASTGPGGPIWSLLRTSSEASFERKKELHYAERGEPDWPSAQLSTDGKRLYWYEIRDEKASSWVTTREELDLAFGKPKKVVLPGGHPCLSADELRQYTFDGKQLRRARRPKLDGVFSEPRVIAELDLPGYVPHPERRQFWVSDDEQWLYYAENPESSGNLYVVRLHTGPGRGVLVNGKSIPAKMPEAVATVEPAEMPEIEGTLTGTTEPEKPPVDPKSLPTPYADFQQKLIALLAKRDVSAALALIQSQSPTPVLQEAKELIAWDQAEVEAIQKVWDAVETAAQQLKPGDSVQFGGTKFTFDSYADGVLQLTASTKKVTRKLRELPAGELLLLAEKVLDKSSPETQLATGIFLHFEGKGQVEPSKLRLKKAGSAGEEFLERIAVRRLKIIEQELARQNLGTALQLIEELTVASPKSPSAAAAEKHRQQIYSFVKWKEVGDRTWARGDDTSYIATAEKKLGSWLLSEQEYGNFDLSLEWRTTSRTGQGGIYFRYPGSGKPLETAFKIHLANDAGVKPDKFCTGSLFNFNAPTQNLARPSGQWNTLSMQVREDRVLVLINGKKVQESLARDAAVPLRGFIALDGEIGGIDYRKVLLVEASPSPVKK